MKSAARRVKFGVWEILPIRGLIRKSESRNLARSTVNDCCPKLGMAASERAVSTATRAMRTVAEFIWNNVENWFRKLGIWIENAMGEYLSNGWMRRGKDRMEVTALCPVFIAIICEWDRRLACNCSICGGVREIILVSASILPSLNMIRRLHARYWGYGAREIRIEFFFFITMSGVGCGWHCARFVGVYRRRADIAIEQKCVNYWNKKIVGQDSCHWIKICAEFFFIFLSCVYGPGFKF